MQDKDHLIVKKLIKYCIEIEDYIGEMNESDFKNDNKTIFACAFCLGQIGELVKKISDETKKSNPQISWNQIYGLRNRIIHDYEGINLSRLWIIVNEDIPDLKIALRSI